MKRVTYILFRQKINVLKNRSQNKYTLHTYFTKHCPWTQKVAISWLGGGGILLYWRHKTKLLLRFSIFRILGQCGTSKWCFVNRVLSRSCRVTTRWNAGFLSIQCKKAGCPLENTHTMVCSEWTEHTAGKYLWWDTLLCILFSGFISHLNVVGLALLGSSWVWVNFENKVHFNINIMYITLVNNVYVWCKINSEGFRGRKLKQLVSRVHALHLWWLECLVQIWITRGCVFMSPGGRTAANGRWMDHFWHPL